MPTTYRMAQRTENCLEKSKFIQYFPSHSKPNAKQMQIAATFKWQVFLTDMLTSCKCHGFRTVETRECGSDLF